MLITLKWFGRHILQNPAESPEDMGGGGAVVDDGLPPDAAADDVAVDDGPAVPDGLTADELARLNDLGDALDGKPITESTDGSAVDDTAGQPGEGEPDPKVLALAASYGLTQEQVAGMTIEDLYRFGALFDQRLLAGGQSSATGTPTPAAPATTPAPTPTPTPAPTAAQPPQDWFDDDEYQELDPGMQRVLSTFRTKVQAMEGMFSAMQEQHRLEVATQQVQYFDKVIDSLDMPDFYGSGKKLTPEQHQRRNEVWLQLGELQSRAQQNGLPYQLDETLVDRAARVRHLDHFEKHHRSKLGKQLRSSAGRRMGTTGRPTVKTTYDGPISEHPDLIAAWDELEAQSHG